MPYDTLDETSGVWLAMVRFSYMRGFPISDSECGGPGRLEDLQIGPVAVQVESTYVRRDGEPFTTPRKSITTFLPDTRKAVVPRSQDSKIMWLVPSYQRRLRRYRSSPSGRSVNRSGAMDVDPVSSGWMA